MAGETQGIGTEEGRRLGAATLRLRILGIDELVKNLSDMPAKIVTELVSAAEVGQARVVNAARRIVPVRTGALQASIGAGRILIDDKAVSAEVVAAMPYATYVEKRKPYLGPALHENNAGFVKSINLAVAKGLKKMNVAGLT